jgi:hypothetical protein
MFNLQASTARTIIQ